MRQRKHNTVLLYMITTWIGPKIVVEVSKANWISKIKQWTEAGKPGLKIQFLIVEKQDASRED